MRLVLRQADDFDPSELRQDQNNIKAKQELDREEHWKRATEAIILKAPPSTQKAIREAREKVASNWVTTHPLDSHHTILHKGDFRDAVFIRYNWQPPFLPDTCCCGANFSLQHALDCQTGGYRTLQHDEVKQVVAELLKEAHFAGVEIEPRLQPLSGESFLLKSVNKDDEARSDVKCLGFWTRYRWAYFDIKVVSPFAKSYSHLPTTKLLTQSEQSKIRQYAARIRGVEHADFSPLAFTTTGAMGPRAQQIFKRICEKIAGIKEIPYSVVSGWMRTRFSFALLRTTLICLRGTRKKRDKPGKPHIDLAVAEADISF